jgi:2-C-methyl-D-erythritol 2,4-cyclodiphosphate synthase
LRIGHGFDVHRLVEGRPCIIGGVSIPFERGLLGHSDADVLLHAIADALLGAAGLGDIGRHFPDTDPEYKNADSLQLLARVYALLAGQGWAVANVDATVICERPRIMPHTARMVENIRRVLQVEPGAVNIKATTSEGLGFTGRGEGIAAQAVCLLVRAPGPPA